MVYRITEKGKCDVYIEVTGGPRRGFLAKFGKALTTVKEECSGQSLFPAELIEKAAGRMDGYRIRVVDSPVDGELALP